jgi:hypothetical protein
VVEAIEETLFSKSVTVGGLGSMADRFCCRSCFAMTSCEASLSNPSSNGGCAALQGDGRIDSERGWKT